MGRVENKIAIVTGAASGIGRGCARLLVAEGARVVCTDRDPQGAQVAAELGATFVALDVTDEDGWQRVVAETVAVHGRLDILVNAAGVAVWGDIERTTLEQWRFVNGVNAEGTFLGCRAAIGAMKQTGGGSIVNISSVAGLVADPDAPAYCASKGAVRLLTKSVALHAARRGYNVRCNSVHPSFIDTPMVDQVVAGSKDAGKMRTMVEKAAPLGRLGHVDDVAYAVIYLASDESKFVTGSELVVDGGLTAR
ncbi:MAG TPA: glucose 1-dehydrogenase [Kofleriaceae bacterium]|nr:glucose 1-dehydrogenase [Kofleriaceae bacterium]